MRRLKDDIHALVVVCIKSLRVLPLLHTCGEKDLSGRKEMAKMLLIQAWGWDWATQTRTKIRALASAILGTSPFSSADDSE